MLSFESIQIIFTDSRKKPTKKLHALADLQLLICSCILQGISTL